MSRRESLPLLNEREDPFLRAILAEPDDEAPRLIYADWLEEQGDVRGEYLRIDCALRGLEEEDSRFDVLTARLRELHSRIDPRWLATVAHSSIEMCSVNARDVWYRGSRLDFAFRCPKSWDRLALTEDTSVRYCEVCRANVYYCRSMEEAWGHARQSRCVALDVLVPRHKGDLGLKIMGNIAI